MTEVSIYISSLLQYLNGNVQYALLRNYEGLPSENSSRDIDIIISRREYRRCKGELLKQLTRDDWRIFSYLDNGRLITFVMAKIEGEEVNMVQWDFFMETSVHGVILLSGEEAVGSRIYNGVLYHVSKEYEFLDKYLYNRAVGAEYPQRYSAIKDLVRNSEIVKDKLNEVFRCADVERVDKMTKLLRRAFWRNMLRSPLSTLVSVVGSLSRYVASYLQQSVAPTLAFTGADGVGKTTIVELLKDKLSAVYAKSTVEFHFRPTLIPNIGEVAHSVGVKREVDRDYGNPHRGAHSGVVSSIVRLCYYTADYVVGYWLKVKPHSRVTRLIIFDRYYNDVIVDSRRSSIFLPIWFLRSWGRLFIPRMSYNFLITAHTESILARKQELSREGIERINSNMTDLSSRDGYYLVENNCSVQTAVVAILDIVIEKQHNINVKRV